MAKDIHICEMRAPDWVIFKIPPSSKELKDVEMIDNNARLLNTLKSFWLAQL